MDKRWLELGSFLVNKAVAVKYGEKVMIAMTEPETFDLTKSVYEAVIKAGGYPQVQILSEEFKHSLLKYGNQEQISWIPEIEAYGMDWADVYINIRGTHNLFELADIPAEKIVIQQTVNGRISELRWKKTRWTLIRVPSQAFAVGAKRDYETVLDMFFNACFEKFEISKWEALRKRLENGKRIRVLSKDTDLTFSVENRKWILSIGGCNIPDGEIFTAPDTATINGTICFENPGVLSGKLINGIKLKWENGKLTEASSDDEKEFFKSIIDIPGANTIGEFAIGINKSINCFCNDILYDEKIYGTIHIALGRSYPQCGGTNDSSIHWDLIKDFRISGSKLFIDNEIIMEDGEYYINKKE